MGIAQEMILLEVQLPGSFRGLAAQLSAVTGQADVLLTSQHHYYCICIDQGKNTLKQQVSQMSDLCKPEQWPEFTMKESQ